MRSTEAIVSRFNRAYAKKAVLERDVRSNNRKAHRLTREVKALEQSRFILVETEKTAQVVMKQKIESLITLAIRSVFDRNLSFQLVLEEKRNHVEARPLILEDGYEYDPKDDLGGGLIDIISFAFRITLWQLSNPRTRNIFILDEPFKFTGVLIEKAGEMLQLLAKELDFQVIMVSHDEELINICNRVYRTTHDGTETKVTLVKGKRKIKRR